MIASQNYRAWARASITGPLEAPEPLSTSERRRLSEAAVADRHRSEMRYLGQLLVWTPTQVSSMHRVREVVEMASINFPGAQQSLYALGKSGTGKSTAMSFVAHALHDEFIADVETDETGQPIIPCEIGVADYVPVVWIDLISGSRTKGVADQLVTYFRREVSHGETGGTLTKRAVDLAVLHGAKVVFLDEVDNLATERSDRVLIYNMVKNLNTALGKHGIAFVYVGRPDEQGHGNLENDPQLRNRVLPCRFTEMDLDLNTREIQSEHEAWRDHLLQWERALAPLLPNLARGDLGSRLARKIWARTHGSIALLSALLKNATRDVLRDQSARRGLTITEAAVRDTVIPVAAETG